MGGDSEKERNKSMSIINMHQRYFRDCQRINETLKINKIKKNNLLADFSHKYITRIKYNDTDFSSIF